MLHGKRLAHSGNGLIQWEGLLGNENFRIFVSDYMSYAFFSGSGLWVVGRIYNQPIGNIICTTYISCIYININVYIYIYTYMIYYRYCLVLGFMTTTTNFGTVSLNV